MASELSKSLRPPGGVGEFSRRTFLSTASAIAAPSLLNAAPVAASTVRHRSVIYIFLSGGLGQQDSFDMKPHVSTDIRGEFDPIATKTPGLQICEHLPQLAACSDDWSVVRSMTHPYNEHSQGHMAMLSGRTDMPIGFNPSMPQPTDHPSIAALMGAVLPERNGLPASLVLPEKFIHKTGRVIPGQFAGQMGRHADPWILSASRFNAKSHGAWPEFEFNHQAGDMATEDLRFRTPALSLPAGCSLERFGHRRELLAEFQGRDTYLEEMPELGSYTRYRDRAISMLGDGRLQKLFDIQSADPRELERYGRNTFGWSLLLSRRLVEEGVGFVQVNLGNNETWDTHGNAFPHLKNYLLPPMDQSVSALLGDLKERGLLDSTLVVMAGEFGRTPKVSHLAEHYDLPGRDHWGAAQSVMLAGAGFGGGAIIGSTDKHGGQVTDQWQKPENLAATMYSALGLPRTTQWHDLRERPMQLYNASPIG